MGPSFRLYVILIDPILTIKCGTPLQSIRDVPRTSSLIKCTSANMATCRALANDPKAGTVFSNRLTHMSDSHKLVVGGKSAFIALDTEHVALDSESNRVLHQVGLAYLPVTSTIMNRDSSLNGRPRLSDFYDNYQLRCLTINIDMSEQTQSDLLRIPKRRPCRFGQVHKQSSLKNWRLRSSISFGLVLSLLAMRRS
ncbi:hypothetical protein GGR57DRAFT_393192 [Xylariaceae sp. FL1272]|nr:hypothetical protein GGR57DRAFT_393192 [Xylariaceae sp. FL1272]